MNTWLIRFAVLVLALGIAAAQTKKADKTDAEIKQDIIKQSNRAAMDRLPTIGVDVTVQAAQK